MSDASKIDDGGAAFAMPASEQCIDNLMSKADVANAALQAYEGRAMTDLSQLIERVEAATEGSRELDRDICVALGWHQVETNVGLDWRTPCGQSRMIPHLTTSIDAALTLLPKGMEFELTNLYGVAAVGMGLNTGSPCYARREDGNITLALLSAILRARQAMQMEART